MGKNATGRTFVAGKMAGAGTASASTGTNFQFWSGLALDASGNAYVTAEYAILKFSPAGVMSVVAGGDVVVQLACAQAGHLDRPALTPWSDFDNSAPGSGATSEGGEAGDAHRCCDRSSPGESRKSMINGSSQTNQAP